MAVWRPPQEIRCKVIGLIWRRDQILIAEVENDAGQVKGVRPLGGSVEFGETLADALTREFQEELGCEIEILSAWKALENIYLHEGDMGHEIVFAASARLVNSSFYESEEMSLGSQRHSMQGALA